MIKLPSQGQGHGHLLCTCCSLKKKKKKKKTLKVLKEQDFEFALHNGNYLHRIYIVLGTRKSLEMI